MLELVQTADMVAVRVRRHRDQIAVEIAFDERAQRTDPHAGVDDEVGISTLHVPHVATEKRVNVGFGHERDALADPLAHPPDVARREMLGRDHAPTVDRRDAACSGGPGAPNLAGVADDVHFEPSDGGFHGRITGALTLEKIAVLQTRSREHFGEAPAVWAVIDLLDAVPLQGIEPEEQDLQVDNVNRVARNLLVVRRDEFRLAIIGEKRDFDELLTLLAEAGAGVSQSLPGRRLEVQRFDDPGLALAWARDEA